jgi:predicted glycogen debranching enzyme
MIRFGEQVCIDRDATLRREWLETNGIGGFSSATINGCNTRRYHGLLVAATKPPVGRFVLLSKLEETLIIDGRRYELGTNRYPGIYILWAFSISSNSGLIRSQLSRSAWKQLRSKKKVFMLQGENTTVIQYWVKGKIATFRCKIAAANQHKSGRRVRATGTEGRNCHGMGLQA